MLRLRIRRTDWPRPALILTDTPHPDCPDCLGMGGHAYDYGDESGEYAGTEWDPCLCWDEERRSLGADQNTDPWAPTGGYSDEPPF
ncbi:hypothetical protein ABZY68_00580 [Streptomyces sp. NPDC006482]|uniref:hypothetical protein n=1 Tax=Streptomyces sp. NPDC006482 TaxID=3154306 RepID=UPI0033B6B910